MIKLHGGPTHDECCLVVPPTGAQRPVDDPQKPDGSDPRNEFQRDADRILYSSHFRRLSGVTQVVSPGDGLIHHDRLIHTLKVAQVGRRIAERLAAEAGNGPRVDPEVVYTAALAHDLGHPPFGHAAEHELQRILDGLVDREGLPCAGTHALPILADGFEGNAQTFRIVARTAARKMSDDRVPGLNLTYRSLAAIQKYPWRRAKGQAAFKKLSESKWGTYASEAPVLNDALDATASDGLMGAFRSYEADIMDWADDVSYAVHDTEDFFRAGVMPLHEMRSVEGFWKEEFIPYVAGRIKLPPTEGIQFDEQSLLTLAEEIAVLLPKKPYQGDQVSREQLHGFGSAVITSLLQDLEIDGENGRLVIPERSRLKAELLKELTRLYVIYQPSLYFTQQGQRAVIRDLFFGLWDAVKETGGEVNLLPPRLNDYVRLAAKASDNASSSEIEARAVVDFLCGLTDRQATNLVTRLAGRPRDVMVDVVGL